MLFFEGGTLTITGTYLLVTFAPNVPQDLTARRVQNYLVSWPFLVYSVSIQFILLPQSEKLGLSGFLQHCELLKHYYESLKTALEDQSRDFHMREQVSGSSSLS